MSFLSVLLWGQRFYHWFARIPDILMLNLLSFTCCDYFPQFIICFLILVCTFFFFLIMYFLFGFSGSLLLGTGFLWCAGFLWQLLLLWSRGSVAVAQKLLSCSEARGIFLDQRLNLQLLHYQVGSQPLEHHSSPCYVPFYTGKQFKIAFESMKFAVFVMNPNSHTRQFCVLLWFSFCCPVSSSAKWAITFLPLPLTLYDYQIALIYFKV